MDLTGSYRVYGEDQVRSAGASREGRLLDDLNRNMFCIDYGGRLEASIKCLAFLTVQIK